ncbi:Hypp9312 [Branchiostoma lanceolatum]|uniref:Hypp9312 protein n=1 Tax=Branchiostoma lanceolatum TaxID=7740 RepID=A0A8S4MLC7_BRALA|nr:Hypp9312 [Branchiostoma lanceolatum]
MEDLWRQHTEEMGLLEGSTFTINEAIVTFEFVPSADQKSQCWANNETTNAATFPSPFADVSKETMAIVNGQIGEAWQPWTHASRTVDAAKSQQLLGLGLKSLAKDLLQHYNAVTLPVWTVAKAIPYHAQVLWSKYHIGYGILSLQAKESKHSALKKDLLLTNRCKDPGKDNKVPRFVGQSGYCLCGRSKASEEDEVCESCEKACEAVKCADEASDSETAYGLPASYMPYACC